MTRTPPPTGHPRVLGDATDVGRSTGVPDDVASPTAEGTPQP